MYRCNNGVFYSLFPPFTRGNRCSPGKSMGFLRQNSKLDLNFRPVSDIIGNVKCRCDGMVDVADSKSAGGDSVWVRVPPPAPSSETLDTSAFEASSVFPFLQQEASISLCFFTVLSAVLSTILFQTLVLMPGSMITTLLIFDAEVFFDDVSRCA